MNWDVICYWKYFWSVPWFKLVVRILVTLKWPFLFGILLFPCNVLKSVNFCFIVIWCIFLSAQFFMNWKKFLAFAFKGNVPILLSPVELYSHSVVEFLSFCFIFICSSFLCALFRRYLSLRSPLLNHLSLSLCLSVITSSQKNLISLLFILYSRQH